MSAPGVVTLAQIRTAAALRADMGTPTTTSFVTISEWNSNISSSWKELYDLQIGAYGEDYFVSAPVSFTTDGVSQQFALPDGTLYSGAPALYKLLGVDLKTGGATLTLKKFAFGERNRNAFPNVPGPMIGIDMRYRIQGSTIWFDRIPASGQTIQLWYIPEPQNLVNDTDSFDGIAGWEEYVIVDSAIKALLKEESDVSVLMARKEALRQRLISMASDRDVGMPARVIDVVGDYGSDIPGWEC